MRSASVDPEAHQYLEEDQDSDVSVAESTISTTTRGRKKAATSTARSRKPAAANRRKPRGGGGKDYDSELESIAGSPPPAPEPRGRAPRGKKRTSSALGANRVSLFDANDFVEEQFAKPAAPAPAKGLRQSKRSRVSTASNAVVDEDQEMHYESDASVATNATGAGAGASKRKRGTASGRGAKAISRYQIPGDEEIDRALELDLERELSDDGDTTRYIKPFIKTPKRRLTRNKMIRQIQAEGQPPAIGGTTIGAAASSKSAAKKFTPAGMRNYFANQDLDYSLPISIPRHLAVRGEDGEFEHMEEDTPIKEKPVRGGKKVVEKVPEPEPEPMQDDDEEIVIVSEKITKKGGKGKAKKPTAKATAAVEERTTAAAVVAAAQAAAAQAPPPAKRTARPIERVPVPEAREPSPARLRNIRKSIDGGMVLFDGGATSSEDESDAPAAPQPWEPTPEQMEEEPPAPKGRKGGKKATTTAAPPPPPPAKGKRGKAARAPTPEPEPEPIEEEPEPVPEEGEALPTPPPAPAKGKKGKKATVSKKAATADTSMTSAASAPRSPSPAPVLEAANKRSSRSRTRDSGGARLSAAENVVRQKLGLVDEESMPPPAPEPKGKRAVAAKEKEQEKKRESGASNRSVRSGGAPSYVSSKSTVNYDDVLARSFAKKQPTEEVVVVDKDEEEGGGEEVDLVIQQLAIETEVAEERSRSLETRKEGARKGGKGRPFKKGRKVDSERESESEEMGDVVVVKPAGTGRGKKQEKGKGKEQEKEDSDPGEGPVTRRQSNRFRSSIRSPPKYADPSSSSEEEEEEGGRVEGREEEEERDEGEIVGEEGAGHGEDGEDEEEEVQEHEVEAEYQGEDQDESEEDEGESESDFEDQGKTTSSPKKSSPLKAPKRDPTTTTAVGKSSSLLSSKTLSSPIKSIRRESKSKSMQTSEHANFAQTIPEGRGRYADDTTTATEEEGDDGETTPQPDDDSASGEDGEVGGEGRYEVEEEEEEEEVEQLSPPKPRALTAKQKQKQKSKAPPPPKSLHTTRLPFSPMKAANSLSSSSSSTTHSKSHSHSLPPLPIPIPTTRGFSSSHSSSPEAGNSHPPRLLESTHPWTPTDPDDIAPLGGGEIDIDMDLLLDRNLTTTTTAAADDDDDDDDGGNRDGEGDLLTPEEKSMTVQEWVRRNADMAEERFRERCEGMIGRLVEEGRRAVRAIEGIRGGG